MRKYKNRACMAIILIAILGITVNAQGGCIIKTICLKVMGSRVLTESDKNRSPLSFQTVAVKMRLSNESDREVTYLSGLNSVQPAYFRLSRIVGHRNWESKPSVDRRTEESLKSSGISGIFKYLRLPPHTALEFEIHDWASKEGVKQDEHAFSIFINLDPLDENSKPVELISEEFFQNEK